MTQPSSFISHRSQVLHLVPEARGGICRHVSVLCRLSMDAGLRCHIVGPAGSLLRITYFGSPKGIKMNGLLRSGSPGAQLLSDIVALRGIIDPSEFIHAHGYRAALTAALARLHPTVVTAHNLPPRLALPVVRFALARADAVIAVSTAVADALVTAGVPAARIRVIPNGIELSPLPTPEEREAARTALRTLLPALPGGPLLLAVGRLSLEKGLDVLIGAFEALAKSYPTLGLVVVGEGPRRVNLESFVPPKLRGRMVLAGHRSDAPTLMAGADVVVIPSRQEGQSLVALEALVRGTRVVASNVGGLPEMIRPGETGWLARPGDSADLARAITEALTAPADRFSDSGRALLKRFDIHDSFRKILEVYREITSPGS